MDETPLVEELLEKLRVLEENHACLEQELLELSAEPENQRALSIRRSLFSSKSRAGCLSLTDVNKKYLNILQSIGHSVHILDLDGRIIYWNKAAENLFGYSVAEALGQNAVELLAEAQALDVGHNIVHRLTKAESWSGQFPIKKKMGEGFPCMVTCTPFYDDDGTFIGALCLSYDMRRFRETRVPILGMELLEPEYLTFGIFPPSSAATQVGVGNQQPLQNPLASRITNLASKVSNKVKSRIKAVKENVADYKAECGDSRRRDQGSVSLLSGLLDDGCSSGASTPRHDLPPSPFSVFSKIKDKFPGRPSNEYDDHGEEKRPMHKIITSKAEAWIGKKGISWPRKENEQEASEARNTHFRWPWLHNDQGNDSIPQNGNCTLTSEKQVSDSNLTCNEAIFRTLDQEL